jgi:tRNA (cmo5U34)-methyltransferase
LKNKEDAKQSYDWKSEEQVQAYLSKTKNLPHQEEIKKVLLEQIPTDVKKVLDLGTGDGRLLELVKSKNPQSKGIALDFSEPMLKLAKKRFNKDKNVKIIKHDLKLPLPELGSFDLIISGLAIHHLTHQRKKQLYQEVFNLLESKGMFFNLDQVSSSTKELHYKFLAFVGLSPDTDDHGNLLLDIETQLRWLREIGFIDVDCYWKWLEIALFIGTKPRLEVS